MPITNTGSFLQYRRNWYGVPTTANSTYSGSASGISSAVLVGTIGPDGGLMTKASAIPLATVTITQLQLFISRDGGGSLQLFNTIQMPAYTMAQTTTAAPTNFTQVDGSTYSESDGYPLTGVNTFGVTPIFGGVTAGSANALTLPYASIPASPTVGTVVYFEATTTNTTTTTMAPGLQSAQTMVRDNGGTALVANDILKGMRYGMRWDGTSWRLFITDRIYAAIGVTLSAGIVFNLQIGEF
jgi:hypothetical protein